MARHNKEEISLKKKQTVWFDLYTIYKHAKKMNGFRGWAVIALGEDGEIITWEDVSVMVFRVLLIT
jgi:hypothetical protein